MTNLYIFAGLPGTGKSTLAQQLARRFKAVHLRIDTIEQGLRDLCDLRVEGEGYRMAYRIAAENLRLGIEVIAASCNPNYRLGALYKVASAIHGSNRESSSIQRVVPQRKASRN